MMQHDEQKPLDDVVVEIDRVIDQITKMHDVSMKLEHVFLKKCVCGLSSEIVNKLRILDHVFKMQIKINEDKGTDNEA